MSAYTGSRIETSHTDSVDLVQTMNRGTTYHIFRHTLTWTYILPGVTYARMNEERYNSDKTSGGVVINPVVNFGDVTWGTNSVPVPRREGWLKKVKATQITDSNLWNVVIEITKFRSKCNNGQWSVSNDTNFYNPQLSV